MANGDGGTSGDAGRCSCKVGAAIAEYSLDGMNRRIRTRWTGRDVEKWSVRELTEYFNRELLAAAVRRRRMTPLEGEVENLYRLLTGDDVSSGVRTQARKRLEREGVDVEGLLGAFVSHQTVYRHLRQCLDATPPAGDETDAARVAKSKRKLQSLQTRTRAVTEDTLRQLRDADRIAIDSFNVVTDVSVVCRACGAQYTVEALLDERGCECQRDA